MLRAVTERRLFEVASQLRSAREELALVDEQLEAFAEAADEARVRSLVSETPLAQREFTEAQRHADAMARTRQALADRVAELARSQDDLLDKLVAAKQA